MFTVQTKDPQKQGWANAAIEREKLNNKPKTPTTNHSASLNPKKEFVNHLGRETATIIEKMVDDSREEIKNIWNKFSDQIKISNAEYKGTACCDAGGRISVNKNYHTQETKYHAANEVIFHESGHSIDRAISNIVEYRYSTGYKDGLFEKTILQDVKRYEKKIADRIKSNDELREKYSYNGKVNISHVRSVISKELKNEGFKKTGDVSDIFEGATHGKTTGSGGHGKSYWKNRSVAIEAFAEMFSATITNKDSLGNIQKYLPESYKVFLQMIKEV